MANKIINIQQNQTVEKKDFTIGDSQGNASSVKYVYMDVDINSGHMKFTLSDLSSISQYEDVLGTEYIDSIKYPIVELSNDNITQYKIFLNSRSTLKITKSINDLVNRLRGTQLEQSKIYAQTVDDHEIKMYRY